MCNTFFNPLNLILNVWSNTLDDRKISQTSLSLADPIRCIRYWEHPLMFELIKKSSICL